MVSSWRRLVGGALFVLAAAVVSVVSLGTGELAGPVVRYGVGPALALVGLGIGHSAIDTVRRRRIGRFVDGVAAGGMLVVSPVSLARGPGLDHAFYVAGGRRSGSSSSALGCTSSDAR